MKNIQSIKRSNELTEKAQDFYAFKKSYMSYMNDNKCVQENKLRILEEFCASESDWDNWEWQLNHRISSPSQIMRLFGLSNEDAQMLADVSQTYRFSVTPYYLAQVRSSSYDDPIYLQCVPSKWEMNSSGVDDPMNEEHTNPAGAITRRYPDRVIVNITNCCPMFCRHCQRRRNILSTDVCIDQKTWAESIEYISEHTEIRDVLLTGGDPLTMPDEKIEFFVRHVRQISTVEIIRIGTRTPVTLPHRITPALVTILKKYAPIYLNTQFNHPLEITPEAHNACELLADNGIVLGNQMVFLKNINNNQYVVQLLNQLLLKCRVRPYYIFHPKKVTGTQHFEIPVDEGIEIVKGLIGHTSGLAIPAYVYNAENGLGKIRLNPCGKNLPTSIQTWEGHEIDIRNCP